MVSGADEMVSGADEMVSGADEMVSGADEMVSGADEMVNGADEMVSGADEMVPPARQSSSRASRATLFVTRHSTSRHSPETVGSTIPRRSISVSTSGSRFGWAISISMRSMSWYAER